MNALPRRRFLRGLIRAAACFGLFGFAGGASVRHAESEPSLKRRLRAVFRSPENAGAVGAAYLAQHPEGLEGALELAAFLDRTHPGRPGALCQALKRRRERDFRADRIVVLEGWIFSATEAQACALMNVL